MAELASQLPEHVTLLVDEAYIEFQTVEDRDAVLRLVDTFPRLVVFRTFSKIWGLSGLRGGYAVASPAAAELLGAIAPALGINAMTQAALLHAVRTGDPEIARRRLLVVEQRRRVLQALHDLPVDAPESEANFVWLHAAGLSGAELGGRLERAGVRVALGGPLGADDHVRASIRGAGRDGEAAGALDPGAHAVSTCLLAYSPTCLLGSAAGAPCEAPARAVSLSALAADRQVELGVGRAPGVGVDAGSRVTTRTCLVLPSTRSAAIVRAVLHLGAGRLVDAGVHVAR